MSNNCNSDNKTKLHPIFSKSNIPPPIYSVIGAAVGYRFRHAPLPAVIFLEFTSSYITHSYYIVTKALVTTIKNNN